jgi:hypothetical protein
MAGYSNSVVVGPGCQRRVVMISKEQFEISIAGYYVWRATCKYVKHIKSKQSKHTCASRPTKEKRDPDI